MIAALFVQKGGTLGARLAAGLQDGPWGCWLWTGSKNAKGYGQISIAWSKPAFTHRVAWMIAHGEWPGELCVLHRCDVPACCNPDHLFLGTRADNNADMRAKGRAGFSPRGGEECGKAKLTWQQVREIRASELNGPALGKIYGVCRSTISQVRRGLIWRAQ